MKISTLVPRIRFMTVVLCILSLATLCVFSFVCQVSAVDPPPPPGVSSPIACSPDATIEQMIASLPDRFDGSRALSGEVRFKFTGGGDDVYYTLVIADGVASVISGKRDNPVLKITCPADVYRAMELGQVQPATAIGTGDLVVNDVNLARSFLEHFPLYYQWCGI